MPCAMEHKPNPGTNCSPGWPVGRSGPSTLRPRPGCRAKVGAAAAPRVEAQWGACQRTVRGAVRRGRRARSEEHTSELQSHSDLVCRLLLEKKNRCKCK